MTEEQKQALIEEGNRILKHGYGTKKSDELIKIALASLTAQPVKLPKTQDAHGSPEPAHIINSRWIESIREAGYEVQE